MKPMFTRVKTERSKPQPTSPKDPYADHSTGARGCCPTSDHSKKWHRAHATSRVIVTTTWGDGHTSRSYEDECKCKFCGHEWTQEWLAAF